MTLNDYQTKARETAVYPKTSVQTNIFYPTLGLAGEAGEIANKVKKVIRDDNSQLTEERRLDLLDECGDVLWYLAELVGELGASFDEVAENNLQKLANRKAKNTLQGAGDKR
jgi:NTP pyrophosphatase (non-canonical NTP hydrolase)